MLDFFGQKELYNKYKVDYLKIIDDTLSNEDLLRGNAIDVFENKLKIIIGREYAIAVNSGTDAILISLTALGVKSGDEIIVPAYSFVASVSPIKILGATPIFVDIDRDTCLIDIKKIESKITSKTKGIIAVDLYGECFDYEKIETICKNHNLFLLEDAAQAYGSSYKQTKAGAFGKISTISFDVSKVVFGISTAGVILTDDKEIANKCSQLRGHGFNPISRDFENVGYNSNMSSVNAALLSYKLDLDIDLSKNRAEIRKYYDEHLCKIKDIKLLTRNSKSKGNNHKYVIFINNREKLQKYLMKKNIPVKVHYDKPIPYYTNFSVDVDVPNSLYISEHVLSLPIHPLLSGKELKFIVDSIKEYYE